MITIVKLIDAGIHPTQAKVFSEPFMQACDRFEINTVPRVAAFFAQCAHESTGFSRLEESLYYRDALRLSAIFSGTFHRIADEARPYTRNGVALANKVYANKLGNGDEVSGDGWRYRGRGLIQLTFKNNYAHAAELVDEPYVEHPEMLIEPKHACLASAAWWFDNQCNTLADAALFDQITAKVNKRSLGAAERREYYRSALSAFKSNV